MSAEVKRTTLILPKHFHCNWKSSAAQMGISMNEFALRALFAAFENIGLERQKQHEQMMKSQLDLFRRG